MNYGDTAWILMSSALVLLMTPGLAFFYAGLVHERSAINTMKMSFIAMAVIPLLWVLGGYSLAFGPGSSTIGSLEWFGLSGVGLEPNPTYSETIPHMAFMSFQMMFAIITPALISGAVVGRMKFKAYVAFILAWSLLVYVPLCRWVWGEGGWLGQLGALDFAGGVVVHISAGVSALVAAIILGPQIKSKGEAEEPHNVPLVILGTGLLWFGWFGFNAGSALAANEIAVLALTTTHLGGAAALATWVAIDLFRNGKASIVGAAIGAVVGLATITPAAGFVSPMSAIAIGVISACVSYLAIELMKPLNVDDTLDVFACHGLGGVLGTLLCGVFASTAVNPGGADGLLASGNFDLLISQLIAVLAGVTLSVIGTSAIMFAIKATIGLRPEEIDEDVEEFKQLATLISIDQIEHGEAAYSRVSVVNAI